jgi:hypothetical protein
MSYFKYFPKVKHSGEILTDITRRVKFFENITTDPYLFLPYTIEDDMRPDELAYFYYDDPTLDWLIFLANNILDPLNEWPLSTDNFNKMLIKKYATQSNLTGFDVVQWTQSTAITDNIIHYYNVNDDSIIINTDTYDLNTANTGPLDSTFVEDEWLPVRYYDYEFNLNESKRSIQLINADYVPDVKKQLKSILK